ncbi:VanZ family protein [Candidatus Bipolaricaulota bacterium]|nr:VanZ family protein [Candidatus Bipolaricaulota bacterium]
MIAGRSDLRTWLWAACVLSAFVVTHVPPAGRGPRVIPDYILHFAGFSALGIVTCWRFAGANRRLTLKAWWFGVAFLAVYGIVDETTQPIFGRSCELSDYLADLCGNFAGMTIGGICVRASASRK